jgi:streptomycin 6-kinase
VSQPPAPPGVAPDPESLPAAFRRNNAADPDWLRTLPARLTALARRWSLTLEPPFPDLTYHYVAPARRRSAAGGERRCVLKLGRDAAGLGAEAAALRLFDGDGAARLLDADLEAGALLMERLRPGTTLVALAARDDDAATRVAAAALQRLWRPAPAPAAGPGLRRLDSWFASFARYRDALRTGPGPLPLPLFALAEDTLAELLATAGPPAVLHGDLHHGNLLRAERAPWLAIDPKGLAGDPPFDVCQFLLNPQEPPPERLVARLRLLVAELGLDARRTKRWAFAHSMLNACWSVEDGDGGWERDVERARVLLAA